MMSIITKSVFGALAGVSLILAAGAASATESSFCPTQFSDLRAAINAGDFVNPEKDQVGLLGKTESAVLKSNSLKVTDALQNLGEIQAKATTLATATKPKLDLDSANAIVAAAETTKTCVGAIAVQ